MSIDIKMLKKMSRPLMGEVICIDAITPTETGVSFIQGWHQVSSGAEPVFVNLRNPNRPVTIFPTCDFGNRIEWLGVGHSGTPPRISHPSYISSLIDLSVGASMTVIEDMNETHTKSMLDHFKKLRYVSGQNASAPFDYRRNIYLSNLRTRLFDLDDVAFRRALIAVGVPDRRVQSYREMLRHVVNYLEAFHNRTDEQIVQNWLFYLHRYDICSRPGGESYILFMAVILQESDAGRQLAERYDPASSYQYHERGGGYMHLTWWTTATGIAHNQQRFFHENRLMARGYTRAMTNIDKMVDYAFVLAAYHPVESACFAWISGNAINSSLSDVVEVGVNNKTDLRLIFHMISLGINGGTNRAHALRVVREHREYNATSIRAANSRNRGNNPHGWLARRLTYNATIDAIAPGRYPKFSL